MRNTTTSSVAASTATVMAIGRGYWGIRGKNKEVGYDSAEHHGYPACNESRIEL